MLALVPPRRHSAVLSPGEAAELPLLRSHFSAIHRTPSLGVKQGACPPISLLNGEKGKSKPSRCGRGGRRRRSAPAKQSEGQQK